MTKLSPYFFSVALVSFASVKSESQTTTSSTSAPRTGLYGAVMQDNAAADNTVLDLTKRPHLIGDQQYIAGYGDADLASAAFSFQGAGFNWFGQAVGGADPDDVRLGIAKGNAFGGGLMFSFAKATAKTTPVPGVSTEAKSVVESDGFGVFGSFNLGAIGDVYGDAAVYTGFDALSPPTQNYVQVKTAGVTTEITPRVVAIMGGWKKDASGEGTHALNAELSINLSSLKTDNGTTSPEEKITEIGLAFWHGYVLKLADGLGVFGGTATRLTYRSESNSTEPKDGSSTALSVRPNLDFQKTLPKGFEAFAGAGVTLAYVSYTNVPKPAIGETESTSLFTNGADMALGLRWVHENLAIEGAIKDAILQNGPHFIGGNAAAGLFSQIGLSLRF